MHYVVGFLFNDTYDRVVLVRKARPKWQAGRLNGVGGAVERTDSSAFEAMVREFREETSVGFRGWRPKPFVSLMTTAGDRVDFYVGASTEALERICTPAGSDEPVSAVDISSLMKTEEIVSASSHPDPSLNPLPNIRWLIQMAISLTQGETAKSFIVVEG